MTVDVCAVLTGADAAFLFAPDAALGHVAPDGGVAAVVREFALGSKLFAGREVVLVECQDGAIYAGGGRVGGDRERWVHATVGSRDGAVLRWCFRQGGVR